MNADSVKYVDAPEATGGTRNLISRVRVRGNERVQWHFAHTMQGTYVTGYDVLPPEDECNTTNEQL